MRPLTPTLSAVCALLLIVTPAAAQDKAPHSRRNAIVEAVERTKNAIVTVRIPRPNGARDMVGSGIIFDERGFIVTNRHVVGANREVQVHLFDGLETTAAVIWADARYDLAVLLVRVDKKLQALPLAPSDDLMVGEDVIAVGHPYGYKNTVSRGIISALGREITMPTGDVLTGLIQHDASINPGNSGGPLLNINGEFIGVNVALRDGAENIAFTISSGTVKSVLEKKLSAGVMAGVAHGLACTEKTLAETGDRQRVVVAGFKGEGALEEGDQILAVGARLVVNSFDVERAFWDKAPGQQVVVRVLRQGQEVSVPLTLTRGQGAGPEAAFFPATFRQDGPTREQPSTTAGVSTSSHR